VYSNEYHCMTMFSRRYEAALALAARRHDGQRRKGGDLPYLTHLVHVARLLEPFGEDAVIAGLLHDVLEDTCKTAEELSEVSILIEKTFGPEILEAVRAVSEDKFDDKGEKIPWRPRKQKYIAHLHGAPMLAVQVSAADKIHNMATLILELEEKGPAIWQKFRAGVEDSIWFYEGVSEVVAERLGTEHALAAELRALVSSLRARSRG
jgi:(p)ppGpp synthase/HD superfamily hydrolase